MKRWLVTGGVGFIGHHLCRALLARGDAVRIVDDYSNAPYPTTMKDERQEMGDGGRGTDDFLSRTYFRS